METFANISEEKSNVGYFNLLSVTTYQPCLHPLGGVTLPQTDTDDYFTVIKSGCSFGRNIINFTTKGLS